VDFNVADWVLNRDNKETKRPHVLTDEEVKKSGEVVVEQLNKWLEVQIYRRGHPMYVSAPGVLSPAFRRRSAMPMGNIFFAHSDSEGGISEYSSAYVAARRVNGEVTAALNKGARAHAKKA
jgi:hypothetical protein